MFDSQTELVDFQKEFKFKYTRYALVALGFEEDLNAYRLIPYHEVVESIRKYKLKQLLENI